MVLLHDRVEGESEGVRERGRALRAEGDGDGGFKSASEDGPAGRVDGYGASPALAGCRSGARADVGFQMPDAGYEVWHGGHFPRPFLSGAFL